MKNGWKTSEKQMKNWWMCVWTSTLTWRSTRRLTKKTSTWEWSGRRRLGCEFKIRKTKAEGPGALTIIQMSDPEIHTCSADKVAPLQCIDAKVSYAVGKKDEGRFGWSKIWNGERILDNCVTLRSKDTNDWQKIFHVKYVERYSLQLQSWASISSPPWG